MRPDELKSANQFNESAHAWAQMYAAHNITAHSLRVRRTRVSELLRDRPLGALLDVGGASGVYFDLLKTRVGSYHIVDVSAEMIELAKKIGDGTCPLECRVGSAYDLPYESASFDTIIAMGLLEYLDQPWQGLSEMARVARDGAVILVSFTNAESPMRKGSDRIYRLLRRPAPYGQVFALKAAQDAARTLNLKLVSVTGYNAQLIPAPFNWRLEPLAYGLSVLLEPLLNRWGRLWGTSYIVEFRK